MNDGAINDDSVAEEPSVPLAAVLGGAAAVCCVVLLLVGVIVFLLRRKAAPTQTEENVTVSTPSIYDSVPETQSVSSADTYGLIPVMSARTANEQ